MWQMLTLILNLSLFAGHVTSQQQSHCSIDGYSPWPTSSIEDNNSARSARRSQFIAADRSSYTFDCHGNVTEWAVDLYPRGNFVVELQVWRELTSRSGCYSLVGENTLSTTVRRRQGTLVTLDVRETPASQIQVQPGDVIGFSVVTAPTETTGGVNLDGSSTLRDVRYASSTVINNQQSLCLSRTSMGAPVISVSVEMSSSPIFTPTPSIITVSSSSHMIIPNSASILPRPTPSPHRMLPLTTTSSTVALLTGSVSATSAVMTTLVSSTPTVPVNSCTPIPCQIGLALGGLAFLALFVAVAVTCITLYLYRKKSKLLGAVDNSTDSRYLSLNTMRKIDYRLSTARPESELSRNDAYYDVMIRPIHSSTVTSPGGRSQSQELLLNSSSYNFNDFENTIGMKRNNVSRNFSQPEERNEGENPCQDTSYDYIKNDRKRVDSELLEENIVYRISSEVVLKRNEAYRANSEATAVTKESPCQDTSYDYDRKRVDSELEENIVYGISSEVVLKRNEAYGANTEATTATKESPCQDDCAKYDRNRFDSELEENIVYGISSEVELVKNKAYGVNSIDEETGSHRKESDISYAYINDGLLGPKDSDVQQDEPHEYDYVCLTD